MLQALELEESKFVDISIENEKLIIKACEIEKRKLQEKDVAQTLKIGRKIMARYHDVFRRLAQT